MILRVMETEAAGWGDRMDGPERINMWEYDIEYIRLFH